KIKEQRAEASESTTRHAQACLTGTILKNRLTQIHVKRIRFVHQVSDKNIFSSITVKVPCIDSHTGLSLSVPIQRSPCQECLVLECAVPLVHPELIGIAVASDVDIDPTVAVEIRSDHS